MIRHKLRDRPNGPEEDRLFDLMRDRAVHGLDDDGMRELNRLAVLHQDIDVECYDRAVASLEIAFANRRCEAIPEDLKARIAGAALRSVATPKALRATLAGPGVRTSRDDSEPAQNHTATQGLVAWSGWVAAAAAASVAAIAWTRSPSLPSRTLETRVLQQAVDAAPDHLVPPWKSTEDEDGRAVSGEVHWSTALQQGYMRFCGLPTNDPTRKQYQLWIFDEPRGTDHPVDGGVVDIAGAEVLVPIDAKIQVSRPALFAVTAEAPGGVVVSRREHIVSLARL